MAKEGEWGVRAFIELVGDRDVKVGFFLVLGFGLLLCLVLFPVINVP